MLRSSPREFRQATQPSARGISRRAPAWGIPLPFDDAYVTYVWVDALLSYASAGSRVWPPDLQIIGEDILPFHAITFVAMLHALGMECPKHLHAHDLFTVNGKKMSKSLGNTVDPEALITRSAADQCALGSSAHRELWF